MSMKWIDGFDDMPTGSETTYARTAGYISASYLGSDMGRASKGRALVLSGPAHATKVIGDVTTLVMGLGYKPMSEPSSEVFVKVQEADTSLVTDRLKIQRTISNGIAATLADGTVIVASAAELVDQGVWCYVEAKIVLNGTSSTVELRVNNRSVGTGTFDGTGFGMNRVQLVATADTWHADDYYLLDGIGSTNTTFLGDVFVQNMPIEANYGSAQFSPVGSLFNYQNVNELAGADDTQYNVATAPGVRDMFSLKDATVYTDQILGVMLGLRTKKIGTGASVLNTVASYGGQEIATGNFAPDADYKTFFTMLDKTPTDENWSVPAFNALAVGYELVSG